MGFAGCWRSCSINFPMCASTLLQLTELFSEFEHAGCEPLAKDPPRLKPLGLFKRLGVVEIVVHHVQSMYHDRNCDVIDREGHADLHALVCTLNVDRTRKVANRNEWSQ